MSSFFGWLFSSSSPASTAGNSDLPDPAAIMRNRRFSSNSLNGAGSINGSEPAVSPRSPKAHLRRASSASSFKEVVTEVIGAAQAAVVTQEAVPTRAHWIPDSKAVFCAIPGCGRLFTLIERKHHCRRCGEAVCRTHFGATLKLNSHAVPDSSGVECEVCDDCFLIYQRRILKFNEPQKNLDLFRSPPFPDDQEESPILQRIRVHLKEGVFYFNRIRNELIQMNNSILKKDLLLSEKARFDQTLNATLEAETLIETLLKEPDSRQFADYLRECLVELNKIKEWAGSSEIFLLRSGRTNFLKTLGLLPEEDVAYVDDKLSANERLGESIMSTVFNLPKDAQDKQFSTLKWLRGRLEHDFYEYAAVNSTDLEGFITRLLKCMEYIDMFIAGSEDTIKLDDKIDELENHYAEYALSLAKISSSETVTTAELKFLEDSIVMLNRDLSIMKSLLHKLADVALGAKGRRLENGRKSFDRKSTGSGASAFQIPPMVARVTDLEIKNGKLADSLNELLEKRDLPRVFLHERVIEQFASLQVHAQQSLDDLESGMESDGFLNGEFED